MPLYDPTAHPLLSPAAQRLDPEALAAQADAAEALLGRSGVALADTAFEEGSTDYLWARLAVVYQVNYQVAAGTDAELLTSTGRGARSVSFRDDAGLISPRAKMLVSKLIPLQEDTDSWPVATGVR
jgi:hypothetical protein